jgi:hypothetical protein
VPATVWTAFGVGFVVDGLLQILLSSPTSFTSLSKNGTFITA